MLVLSVPAAPRLKFDRVQNSAPYIRGFQYIRIDTANELTGDWRVTRAPPLVRIISPLTARVTVPITSEIGPELPPEPGTTDETGPAQ